MMQKIACVALVFVGLFSGSLGQTTVTIPGLGDFTVVASDFVCVRLATSFVGEYASTTGNCSNAALEAAQWAKYRVAYTGSFFPEIRSSTGYADCTSKAETAYPAGDASRTAATGLCTHLRVVCLGCPCDKLSCVTDETNNGITFTESTVCNPFPQKMCLSFQEGANSTCHAAVTATLPGGATGIEFSQDRVPHGCDEASCRAAGNGSVKMSTGGAFFAVGVVALVTSML